MQLEVPPPFLPVVKNESDTSNFQAYDEDYSLLPKENEVDPFASDFSDW